MSQAKKEPDGDGTVLHFFRKEFEIDIRAEYDRLKDIARVPVKSLKDKEVLIAHLNSVAKNAVTARIIASHAKSLRELHRIKWYKEMRRLTRLATRQVDDWLKVKDVKKKQITKDMIMEEIASDDNMCGEYEALVREREELRRMRDVLDEFAKQWSKRFETLRSQLSALKAQREVILGRPER